MKQHITIKQWNELSEKGKDILIPILRETKDCKEGRGYAESCTIGQMIEFLMIYYKDLGFRTDHLLSKYIIKKYPELQRTSIVVYEGYGDWAVDIGEGVSLCDALWIAVKEVLAK